MTLENIIDRTGELEHLNELVMLQLNKAGGFTCTESYFSTCSQFWICLKLRSGSDTTMG